MLPRLAAHNGGNGTNGNPITIGYRLLANLPGSVLAANVHNIIFAELCAGILDTKSLILATLRYHVCGIGLPVTGEQMGRVATWRVIAGMAGKMVRRIATCGKEVRDAVSLYRFSRNLENAVSFLSAALPRPTLVRFSDFDLRPKSGGIGWAYRWQRFGLGHVFNPSYGTSITYSMP